MKMLRHDGPNGSFSLVDENNQPVDLVKYEAACYLKKKGTPSAERVPCTIVDAVGGQIGITCPPVGEYEMSVTIQDGNGFVYRTEDDLCVIEGVK